MVVGSMDSLSQSTEAKAPVLNVKNTSQVKYQESPKIESNSKALPLSEKTVINAIEKANKAIVGSNRALEFSVHEATKEIMVKVIDTQTDEVIREIPSEKILDMVANMLEMAGILIDERR